MRKVAAIAVVVCGVLVMAGAANAEHRPALGVTLANSDAGGALVTGVYPGSPAGRAGLISGDRIVTLNGKEVKTYQDVISIVGSSAADSRIDMRIDRNGWKNNLSVRLGDSEAVFQGTPSSMRAMPAAMPRRVMPLSIPYTPGDVSDQRAYGSG